MQTLLRSSSCTRMGKSLCYAHNILDLARPRHSGWLAASWGSLLAGP
uniref:Uncharacterized protein n=1 Tax=Setaria italica TaxID=4555 RepID=K3Z208_SETIT